jgi:hypothetical protein
MKPSLVDVDSEKGGQPTVKIDAKSKIFRITKKLLILESRSNFSVKRHLCATCCQIKKLNSLKKTCFLKMITIKITKLLL